ncbi:MAG: hypothetical protein J6V22_02990, partial [Clostridia bacterium]|nr:hypothetical protein [Clostridia bacterium]
MPALRVASADTAKKQQNARDVIVRCGRPHVDIRFLSAVASATNRAAGAMAEGDGFLPSRNSGVYLPFCRTHVESMNARRWDRGKFFSPCRRPRRENLVGGKVTMRNTKFLRVASFLLVLCLLLCGGTVAAAAESQDGTVLNPSVTDKTIEDYKEELESISYSEYVKSFVGIPDATETIIVDPIRDLDMSKTTLDWLSDEDFAALKEIAKAFFNEKGAVSHSEAVLKLAGVLLHQLEISGSTDPDMLYGGGAHHKIFDYIRSNFDK